jgi:ribosomal protein L20A (L18A)
MPLFRIIGSVRYGSKNINFMKEVRADTKDAALAKAYDAVKEEHKVAAYQIIVKSIEENKTAR